MQNKAQQSPLLQCFWDLADVDENKRVTAAQTLRELLIATPKNAPAPPVVVKSDDGDDEAATGSPDEFDYCMKRLVRGLSSSRDCARQGFSVAMMIILEQFPDKYSSSYVLNVIDSVYKKSGQMKGQEARDFLLGQLFAYAVLLKCEHTRNDSFDIVMDRILDIADEKSWASDLCNQILGSVLVLLDREVFISKAMPRIVARIPRTVSNLTSSTLALIWPLYGKYPELISAQIRDLPQTHSAADMTKLWNVLDLSIPTCSPAHKSVLIKLFMNTLSFVDSPADILNKNFLRVVINSLHNKSTHLNAESSECYARIIEKTKTSVCPSARRQLLSVLEGPSGNISIDSLTKTHYTADLMRCFKSHDELYQYLEFISKSMNSTTSDDTKDQDQEDDPDQEAPNAGDSRRIWALSKILAIIKDRLISVPSSVFDVFIEWFFILAFTKSAPAENSKPRSGPVSFMLTDAARMLTADLTLKFRQSAADKFFSAVKETSLLPVYVYVHHLCHVLVVKVLIIYTLNLMHGYTAYIHC